MGAISALVDSVCALFSSGKDANKDNKAKPSLSLSSTPEDAGEKLPEKLLQSPEPSRPQSHTAQMQLSKSHQETASRPKEEVAGMGR